MEILKYYLKGIQMKTVMTVKTNVTVILYMKIPEAQFQCQKAAEVQCLGSILTSRCLGDSGSCTSDTVTDAHQNSKAATPHSLSGREFCSHTQQPGNGHPRE